ncbi:LemA family protein [Sphingomonas arantia]|uniref:LemA family protein n=1 Tax=Sphingomonas arantia TaxID=1460676 RepID=A0ABW4TXQ1_9SPHN
MVQNGFAEATDLSGRLVRATNFALDYWWIWPIVLFLLWLGLKLRSQHALIAQLDERADAAFGDIDALLLERHALVGNLAEVVRAFASREHEVIRDVLDARVDALEAVDGMMQGETHVAGVLQNLFSVSDQYPELASGKHYAGLRTDLIRIEERITAARKFFNLAVEEHRAVSRAFPGNLFTKNAGPVREKFSLGERRAEFIEPAKITL